MGERPFLDADGMIVITEAKDGNSPGYSTSFCRVQVQALRALHLARNVQEMINKVRGVHDAFGFRGVLGRREAVV